MSKQIMTKAVRLYLARIGQKGGTASGKAKRRGDAKHYSAMSRKRWDARNSQKPS